MNINDVSVKTTIKINDQPFVIQRLWFSMRTDPIWKDNDRWQCMATFTLNGAEHQISITGPTLDFVKIGFLDYINGLQ